MAVPKKKTSKSRRNRRRAANNNLKRINVIEDKKSGEPRLSHRMCLKDGTYGGRQVETRRKVEE